MFESDQDFDNNPNIIKMESNYEPSEKGLGFEMFRSMQLHKNKVAQYIEETQEADTYDQLLIRCIRAAIHLKSKNLKKDDIICLCLDNNRNTVVPFIATQFLGLRVANLHPDLSVFDTTHILKQIQPKMIFFVPEATSLIENSLNKANLKSDLVIFGENNGNNKYESFSDYLQPKSNENEFRPVILTSNKETAVLMFSSGSTGLPKGVNLTHYGLIGQGVNIAISNCLGTEWSLSNYNYKNQSSKVSSVVLIYSPLYWMSSVMYLMGTVFSGTAKVICNKFEVKQFWKIIEAFKVSVVFTSPTNICALCKASDDKPKNLDISCLNVIWSGGAYCPVKYMIEIEKLLPTTLIEQCYGQTEVSGGLTWFPLGVITSREHYLYKRESCGMPAPGIWYKVVDTNNEEILGPNQQGELRVKTKYLMNGYFNVDSSSEFDKHGWFKTGDLVYYDENRCFYIVDRLKSLIKFRAWQIPPVLLENILHEHPAIKSAIIIGKPHEQDGEHPMAIVVREENQNLTEEDIISFVNEKVTDFQKLRGGVKFLKEIPVTPSQKINRRYIKQLVLDEKI